ncbi:ferredoxin [Cupriavidus basilensis]|uniref:ferredoxin n=1 Tax=Cupriavidus basilensis TaxID=68895 RepID=UPI0023E81419|nr:ferredoxin [Cupriavidus basilensis]MDF3882369.1 ferredoxin [Cupriavidus basilensis]
MYVILSSKPGQFRTELVEGLVAVEAYDYLFYGRKTAHFVIAEMAHPVKVKVIEESGQDADDASPQPPAINYVPSKFLDKFDTLQEARDELKRLATFGSMDISLVRRE